MKDTIKKFNTDIPKICIPVTAEYEKDIIRITKKINKLPADIIEWRADFFIKNDFDNLDAFINISEKIKKISNKPILFTLRSVKEGGQTKYNPYKSIIDIYAYIIENKCFDFIDLELLTLKEEDIKKLIKLSNKNNIKVIISNHDFNKTPSKYKIISIIKKMIKLKADIAKIAYMPKNKKDVITLLDASNEINNFPLIAISMGELGIITRIFGSVLTFASFEQASAPGQLEASKLKYILDNIYNKQ